MSKLYILGAALGLLSSAAYAADLPERMAAPAIPTFTWAGAYIGVNFGYAYGGVDQYPFAIGGGGQSISTSNSALVTSGPLGGGQIGYNFALPNIGLPYEGGIVGGIEADYDAANVGSNARLAGVSPLGASGAGTGTVGTTMSTLGTVRGRLGASFGRLLVFGTGGFAFAQSRSATVVKIGGLGTFSPYSRTTNEGVVFGGGAEYLLTENITAKIEYLHINLDAQTIASGKSTTRSFAITERPTSDIVRVGLDYKVSSLGIPSLPVFASN